MTLQFILWKCNDLRIIKCFELLFSPLQYSLQSRKDSKKGPDRSKESICLEPQQRMEVS